MKIKYHAGSYIIYGWLIPYNELHKDKFWKIDKALGCQSIIGNHKTGLVVGVGNASNLVSDKPIPKEDYQVSERISREDIELALRIANELSLTDPEFYTGSFIEP